MEQHVAARCINSLKLFLGSFKTNSTRLLRAKGTYITSALNSSVFHEVKNGKLLSYKLTVAIDSSKLSELTETKLGRLEVDLSAAFSLQLFQTSNDSYEFLQFFWRVPKEKLKKCAY